MDIGEQRQMVFLSHVGKHLQSAFQSGAAEGVYRRAVCLVEGCLEIECAARQVA